MMRARSPETLLNLVTRALVGVGGAIAIIAVVALLRGLVADREAFSDNAQIHSIEHDLKTTQTTLAKPHTQTNTPKSYEAIGVLESTLKKAVDHEKCQLTEFKAAPEISNYLSLYQREAPEAGWKQSLVHFTIDGPLANVVEAVRSVEASNVPVEIDSINMSRLTVADGGKATVTAQVQLRAIWRDG